MTPSGAVAFGAWVAPLGGSFVRSAQQQAVTEFTQHISRGLVIAHTFVPRLSAPTGWLWRAQWDVDQHRVPMISFGAGVDTRGVAAGRYDAELKRIVLAVGSLKTTVLLRYAWEMDAAASRGWVGSGAEYIAAWRHVHALFAGLPAQWVWAPNAIAFAGDHGGVGQYWPGPNYVDWIGADGYNFFTCHQTRQWRSFSNIYQAFYAWGAGRGKPLIVTEFGTVEDSAQPTRKAQWFDGVGAALSRMPALRAVVYFDSDKDGCNWRIDSSSASLQAFRRLVDAPVLRGRLTS